MSYRSSYTSGDWLAICDSCGKQFKASSLRKRWDGLMVCEGDWEERHPQDFVRGVPDNMSVPWARDEPEDTFVPIHYTLYPVEEADFSDAASAFTGKGLSDTILSSESFRIYRTYFANETITLSETKAFVGLYQQTDSMLLSETVDTEAQLNPAAESQSTSEYFTIHYVKVFPDPVTIVVVGEVVNSSALNGTYSTVVDPEYSDEDFDIFETFFFDNKHSLQDIGIISEVVALVKNYSAFDTITLSESFYADHATLAEAITGSETAIYNFNKGIDESVSATETINFDLTFTLSDSLTASDAIVNMTDNGLTDLGVYSEALQVANNKALDDSGTLSEGFTYSVVQTSRPLNFFALDTTILG